MLNEAIRNHELLFVIIEVSIKPHLQAFKMQSPYLAYLQYTFLKELSIIVQIY